MRVLVLQHIACEHPGQFSDVMRERGVEAVPVELDEGEALPQRDAFDAILAMGGPMSVNDESEHPWLADEKRLVGDAVADGVPFLGVCLGVQLLASALGAAVHPAPAGAEVGLRSVDLTEDGERDPLFASVERPLVALQWHGDTFALPTGAVHLASSPHSAHQAFRVGEAAYGIQFHLEVTPEQPAEWGAIPAYRDSLASTLGPEAGEAFLAESTARAPEMGKQARRLFSNWLDVAEARGRPGLGW